MRLLLDTHAFIWFVLNDAKLSTIAKDMIEDANNDVFVSPATYWEIAIKVGNSKLDLKAPYDDFMRRGIFGNDFDILHVEVGHTSLLTTLPFHHKDPFDRLLAAQALAESIGIVSADAVFEAYGVKRYW